MARQGIFTGSSPNDGTGDSLAAGAVKVNQNFSEIYNTFGDGNNLVSYVNNAGGLTGTPNITVGILTASQFNLTQGEIRVGFNSDFVLSLEDVEGSPTYTFGANGALNLPGNLEIGSGGYILFNNLGSKLQSDLNYDFEIHVGGFANKVWAFSTDGSTTLPNGTKITDIGSSAGEYPTSGLALGNNGFQVSFGSTINDWAVFSGANLIQFESDNNLNLIAGNSVNITGGGIEGPTWQFNSSGNIVFPDGSVQLTAYTGVAGTGGSGYYSVIAGYSTSSGIATVAQGLTGTPNISVGQVGISSFLTVSGVTSFYNNLHLEYDKYLLIGNDNELQLFHNGANSYIDNSSGGNLIIRAHGGSIQLQKETPELMGVFNTDGSVELYYNNVKKFETLSTGATTYGTHYASSFVGDGSGLTNIVSTGSGIEIRDNGSIIGTASTINFGDNLNVSAISAGVVTVTGSASGTSSQWSTVVSGIVTSSNVGIGTTIANSTLTVEGNGRFSGVVTATRFESTSAGTPTLDSPNNLNINAVTVAISTDLTVGGDAYVGLNTSSGLILSSPNGTQYRLIVDNSGNLSTVLVP